MFCYDATFVDIHLVSYICTGCALLRVSGWFGFGSKVRWGVPINVP
jgi:hypothetical protein